MYSRLVLFLLVSVLCYNYSLALKCYACSMGENDADSSCVENPESTTQITCPSEMTYCMVLRIEYQDPKDVVASISRSCSGVNQNSVEEDATFRYYYTSCTTDLCNGGSGKTVSGTTTTLGDKSTIYCPGIGTSGASVATFSSITTFFVILSYVFLKI